MKESDIERLHQKEIDGYESILNRYDEIIIELIHAWISKNWGERCPDYEKGCPLCKAWECFDYLFEEFSDDE